MDKDLCYIFFFFQAEDGIRDVLGSRGLGDVYKRQDYRVYGNASRASGRASSQDQIVTAYFVDVTESRHIQALYESSRP